VTVQGTVSSWAEHDEAIDAAWAAPGVTAVRDDLIVPY
jgi:osmotically-inducible protein OsmY